MTQQAIVRKPAEVIPILHPQVFLTSIHPILRNILWESLLEAKQVRILQVNINKRIADRDRCIVVLYVPERVQ